MRIGVEVLVWLIDVAGPVSELKSVEGSCVIAASFGGKVIACSLYVVMFGFDV